MTGDELKQDVLDWIEEHRHLERHPRAWQLDLAKRLATHEDMLQAWVELAKRGAEDGRNIMVFTFSSAEAAHRECQRLPTTEENERIAAVQRALENLRDAIARAPFLDSALSVVIDDKNAMLSWRKSGAKAAEQFKPIMQTLCLDELLEFAQTAIPDIAARQPRRTVARQRGNPELAAFVRHLAAWLQHRYGNKMMGTIARIASATFDLSEAVSKEQVERILRTPSQ